MSTLELELRKLGVWGAVVSECSKTGQTALEYIASVIVEAAGRSLHDERRTVACTPSTAPDDAFRQEEFARMLAAGPDIGAIEREMRAYGIDPELSKEEARGLWDL